MTRLRLCVALALALLLLLILARLPNIEPALPDCPRGHPAHVTCAP